MPVATENLQELEGKIVVLHRVAKSGDLQELIGTMDKVSPVGIAFREKGKRNIMLLEPNEIEEVALAPASAVAPKRVTQRKMRPVDESGIKQHLFLYHGFLRDDINELSFEDAVNWHDTCDHEQLGHKHEEPEPVEETDDEDYDEDDEG